MMVEGLSTLVWPAEHFLEHYANIKIQDPTAVSSPSSSLVSSDYDSIRCGVEGASIHIS